jgi:hypothetical protein
MTDPRYPIGKLELKGPLAPADRAKAIDKIAAVPSAMRDAVRGLGDAQLDTPYREGGWTVRQVVHHVADSHVNAYVRCKLTLTEESPPAKGYDENAWSKLPDVALPIEPSLALIDAIHLRLVACLRAAPAAAFARACLHSEKGRLTLDDLLTTYAWHGPHHIAHITTLRRAKGW